VRRGTSPLSGLEKAVTMRGVRLEAWEGGETVWGRGIGTERERGKETGFTRTGEGQGSGGSAALALVSLKCALRGVSPPPPPPSPPPRPPDMVTLGGFEYAARGPDCY
jgi:hypothetical protein